MDKKLCLECHKPIKGRADKRFCDDACRNAYNNRLNGDQNNTIRNINYILRKNRRILQAFLGKEKLVKIPLEKLQKEGFKFDYQTHLLHTSKGQSYVFVYEYGYLLLEHNVCLIVKQK
ncbi:hypothetical protein FAZ19_11060 [Sphingobacterium alkalisoli]|uniref:DUF2116 family Zn-ribbon domain-containing protein n=1 Tax=Sphingobacterium alkalisoli TaxID=1874115 RepID=A0A4U0H225_9SPHI|nr:hypothetical protein [Sphingobacterium alkalisoli]TJY65661.1 hypothetical protein FAZ19_11060 [Sphingobacterium alkalisoli]GGH19139.1 hypothetical protein GCM10011418_23290 [Sphingobacterium alkalisoli]